MTDDKSKNPQTTDDKQKPTQQSGQNTQTQPARTSMDDHQHPLDGSQDEGNQGAGARKGPQNSSDERDQNADKSSGRQYQHDGDSEKDNQKEKRAAS